MDLTKRGLKDDEEYSDVRDCKLIQGPLALLAQSVLVLLVIAALVWKRCGNSCRVIVIAGVVRRKEASWTSFETAAEEVPDSAVQDIPLWQMDWRTAWIC